MTGRTHDLAAITALGIIILIQPLPPHVTLGTLALAILANLIGGIAPDIDQPAAPFWRNLPIGGYFGRIFARLLGGHRFLTHSLVGLGLLGGLVYLLLNFVRPILPTINMYLVWYAFMIGAISHLIMDTVTKEGVPWLLPIPIKFGLPPIRALRITTGKAMETFVVFPALLAFNAYWIWLNYARIVELAHTHLVK